LKPITRILSLSLILAVGLCQGASAESEPISIGIIQLVHHPALDAARNGFLDALAENGYVNGENIVIDLQNGQGDIAKLASISDEFVSANVDLVLAIATPAAAAIYEKTSTIPILATAVTDFRAVNLVESNERPGTNVSGTTDRASIEDQIALFRVFAPEAKTIGVLYDAGAISSAVQAMEAKQAIEAMGYAYVEMTFLKPTEVQQTVEAITSICDGLYLPSDNVVATHMPIVHSVTVESKTPVIGAESGQVEGGALATLGINYYKLGYQTGLMAIRLFEDENADISEMPVERQIDFDYCINGTVAVEIGVEIPVELEEYVISME